MQVKIFAHAPEGYRNLERDINIFIENKKSLTLS